MSTLSHTAPPPPPTTAASNTTVNGTETEDARTEEAIDTSDNNDGDDTAKGKLY